MDRLVKPAPISLQVADAARALVLLKRTADIVLSGPDRSLVDPALASLSGPTINGMAFLRACVPFIRTTATSPGVAMMVPVKRLLGDSHKWSPGSVPADKVNDLLNFFMSMDRVDERVPEASVQFGWEALGLFAAHEGKNRVAFLLAHDIAEMPASVTLEAYPSPERIVLYTVPVGGSQALWAVLDDHLVSRPPLLRFAVPLLRAHGIADTRTWPAFFPAPEEIIKAGLACPHTPLDMTPLMTKEKTLNETIQLCLGQVTALRLSSRPAAIFLVVAFICLVAGILTGGVFLYASAFAFGVLMTSVLAFTVPWFRARRGWAEEL